MDSALSATRIPLLNPQGEQGIDDAGCRCRSVAMEPVELRVETDNVNFIGHAFIATKRVTVGFRTADMDFGLFDYLWPFSSTVPGLVGEDHDHAFDRVRKWRACPETVARLEASIAAHANDPYQVGNWRGGRNCATWARDRLREVGLVAPPGDCPNKMAWVMWPRNEVEYASYPCRTAAIGVSIK